MMYADKEDDKEISDVAEKLQNTAEVAVWTKHQHETFIDAIRTHGKQWDVVQEYLPDMKKV